MKAQFLNGGLANQAFQYIYARYYELSHPGEVMYMDDSYFALNTVHNGYELEKVFGIHPHMLSEYFDKQSWDYILEERKKGKSVPQILCENQMEMVMISEVGDSYQQFNPFEGNVMKIPTNGYFPEIMDYPGDVYYHGYWINKNWFAQYQDVFLKEFCFPELADDINKAHMERILSTNSVSVHIRRGDYVSLGWSYGCDVYRTMLENFLSGTTEDWELFVFSDDIAWCKENQDELGFGKFCKVHFVEGNVNGKNYIDLQLMSRCKGMIMSNSAFCYLAALLNTEKQLVINPTRREI